jgi:hypothetical protein
VFIVVRVKCGPQFSVIREMADLKEEHLGGEILLQSRENSSETHEMLKTAFGDNAMGRTQTFG